MTVTWQIVGVLVGLVVLWSGIFLWALKWMLDRHTDQIMKRVDDVEKTSVSAEREVLKLRAELPEKYVQREDAIRQYSVLDAKLDSLREAFSRLAERLYERS